MSTRKGNLIRLDTLLEEGFTRVKRILEEKGRTGKRALTERDIREIAIGAIKYSYLSQDRERDVVFTWDKALSFEGNSGPYIQYAFVRTQNILKEAHEYIEFSQDSNSPPLSTYDKLLIQKLAEYEKKISETLERYKPHILAQYTYELATVCNSFYVHTPKILEESDTAIRTFRLHILGKTASILKLNFSLLGIEMPEEM